MHFFNLNDDVLLRICDYLFGQDALHLSLTSKRLYQLAICRVFATFVIPDLYTLRSDHARLLLDDAAQSRAQHVQTLQVPPWAFEAEYWGLSYDDEDEDGSGHIKKVRLKEGSQLLLDLVQNTHNISRLVLGSCHVLFNHDNRLAPALKALRRISCVEFQGVSDTVVKLIGETGWNLRALSLDYHYDEDTDVVDERGTSLPVLLETLEKFPKLYMLKVEGQNLSGSRSDTRASPVPLFHSIRQLYLRLFHTLPAIQLVSRCPNAEVVDLSLELDDPDELVGHPFSTWPSLRSLRGPLLSLHAACCADRVIELRPVDHLRIPERIPTDSSEDDYRSNQLSMMQCILRRTSPVWVQLWMEVGAAPMHFWSQVPEYAPRLRYLDLKLGLVDLEEECANWLENVPDVLSALPLVYLRLYLLQLPARYEIWDSENSGWLRDANGNKIFNCTKASAVAFQNARTATIETLPERCARAIPTLKYFVLADEGPNYEYFRWRKKYGPGMTAGEDSEEDDLDDGADVQYVEEVELELDRGVEHELDENKSSERWQAGILLTLQSWRVLRGDSGESRLELLTPVQGKRLQRALEASFEGNNKPLGDDLEVYF